MLVLCLVIEEVVMKGRISGILKQISRQHKSAQGYTYMNHSLTIYVCEIQHNTEKHVSTPRFIRNVNKCFQINYLIMKEEKKKKLLSF